MLLPVVVVIADRSVPKSADKLDNALLGVHVGNMVPALESVDAKFGNGCAIRLLALVMGYG